MAEQELTTEERKELRQLRREVRVLHNENSRRYFAIKAAHDLLFKDLYLPDELEKEKTDGI